QMTAIPDQELIADRHRSDRCRRGQPLSPASTPGTAPATPSSAPDASPPPGTHPGTEARPVATTRPRPSPARPATRSAAPSTPDAASQPQVGAPAPDLTQPAGPGATDLAPSIKPAGDEVTSPTPWRRQARRPAMGLPGSSPGPRNKPTA